MIADLPPKIETHAIPRPSEDVYIWHANDIHTALEFTPNPSDLVNLYVDDYQSFLKQFYEYITSEDMKAQMIDGFDREVYKKYMKKYFINMNDNIPLKQIPTPLRKGREDLFRAGANNLKFKKAVQSMLVPVNAAVDKKTGKMKGIYGSDVGSGLTGQMVSLMIELYNTTFVKPAETQTPKPADPTTKAPMARA